MPFACDPAGAGAPGLVTGGARTSGTWGHRGRILVWLGLLLSWVVLLPLLWTAFSTVPSLERLEQSRMVQIPTLRTVGLLAAQTTLEVGVLLALLFPWRPRRWLTRLWLAALAVAVWFVATTPLGLTRMSWIHRRWLALVGVGLLLAAVVGTGARAFSRARSSDGASPDSWTDG